MILLIFTIVMCIIFLSVEIPVFIRYRDETDLWITIISAMMLAACFIVLYFWRI